MICKLISRLRLLSRLKYVNSSTHKHYCAVPSTTKNDNKSTVRLKSVSYVYFIQKTPLEKFLRDKILTSGPITFAEYMQLCSNVYYSGVTNKNMNEQRKIFGGEGDFVTAPEVCSICVMFNGNISLSNSRYRKCSVN
jgi:hypothetical protein